MAIDRPAKHQACPLENRPPSEGWESTEMLYVKALLFKALLMWHHQCNLIPFGPLEPCGIFLRAENCAVREYTKEYSCALLCFIPTRLLILWKMEYVIFRLPHTHMSSCGRQIYDPRGCRQGSGIFLRSNSMPRAAKLRELAREGVCSQCLQ